MSENWFTKSSCIAKLIFVLIVLYTAGAVIVLALAAGADGPLSEVYYNPYVLIGFALVSFALTVFIGAYHLSTLLRRRKRKTDQLVV